MSLEKQGTLNVFDTQQKVWEREIKRRTKVRSVYVLRNDKAMFQKEVIRNIRNSFPLAKYVEDAEMGGGSEFIKLRLNPNPVQVKKVSEFCIENDYRFYLYEDEASLHPDVSTDAKESLIKKSCDEYAQQEKEKLLESAKKAHEHIMLKTEDALFAVEQNRVVREVVERYEVLLADAKERVAEMQRQWFNERQELQEVNDRLGAEVCDLKLRVKTVESIALSDKALLEQRSMEVERLSETLSAKSKIDMVTLSDRQVTVCIGERKIRLSALKSRVRTLKNSLVAKRSVTSRVFAQAVQKQIEEGEVDEFLFIEELVRDIDGGESLELYVKRARGVLIDEIAGIKRLLVLVEKCKEIKKEIQNKIDRFLEKA